MPEIDPDQLNALQKQKEVAPPDVIDATREVPVWLRDDAPKGSTESSLMVYENGVPVRVAGPTHYVHLANGAVRGDYGIGTHYSEPGPNPGDPDQIIPIVGIYGG